MINKTIQFNHGTYAGEVNSNNEPHGHGIFIFVNGNVYDGEWKNSIRCGHGVMKYANGDVYDGNWSSERKDGHGVYTFANGHVYDSEFINGVRCGYGVYTWKNGNKYEGEWVDDNRCGHGVFTYANGNVYDGEWINGKQNGHGIFTFANGQAYDGEFKNGVRCGYGVYTWKNGDKYEGEWLDDNRCGHGIYSFADCRKLEGKWLNNLKEGEFILTYPKGRQEQQLYKFDKLIKSILIPATVSKTKSSVRVTSDSKAPTVSAEDSEALVTALKKISKRFGTECFRKGGKAAAALNDMLPGAGFARQRRRVVTAMNTGACDILFDERETDIQLRINKAYNCLLENDMAEAAAEETVNALAAVIIDE